MAVHKLQFPTLRFGSKFSHTVFNVSRVTKLHHGCLQFVHCLSKKFCSVRDHSTGGSNSAGTEEDSCKCCTTTTFHPQNINFQGQSCTSDSSSNDDSNILNGSGSVYSPEEDIIAIGESESLYEVDSSCTSNDNEWMMKNEQRTRNNTTQQDICLFIHANFDR